MMHRLVRLAAVVSLFACAGAAGLWIASALPHVPVFDLLEWNTRRHFVSAQSYRGSLEVAILTNPVYFNGQIAGSHGAFAEYLHLPNLYMGRPADPSALPGVSYFVLVLPYWLLCVVTGILPIMLGIRRAHAKHLTKNRARGFVFGMWLQPRRQHHTHLPRMRRALPPCAATHLRMVAERTLPQLTA